MDSITRSRKSREYGFGIVPPEIESMPSDSLIYNSLGILPDSTRAENALSRPGTSHWPFAICVTAQDLRTRRLRRGLRHSNIGQQCSPCPRPLSVHVLHR